MNTFQGISDESSAPADPNRFMPLGQSAPAETHSENESASIMADMSGGADMPMDLGGTGKKRFRFSSSLLLIVGVLAISAAALYLMRKAGTGAGMTFVSVPVEYTLDGDPSNRLADHHRVLSLLEASGITIQIPSEDVDKNPFHLKLPGSEEEVELTGLDPEAQARLAEKMRQQQAEARKQEIARALSGLQIHSIMTGSRPVANIGDQLVGIGDAVAEHFTVAEIRDREVVLEADGQKYTLQMAEKQNSPRKRPRRR